MRRTPILLGLSTQPYGLPQDYGLPEEFQSYRPNQEDALDFLRRRSTKRVKALCGPTGFGKTLVVIMDAILSGKPTAFVTHSRALQDQIVARSGSLGIVDLRGRRNYICEMRGDPDYTCEEGHASRCPYKGTHTCPSSSAEMKAAASLYVTTNYDKWIHARKFGMGLSHIQRVVFDEGHEAPEALARAMQVILHTHEINEVLELDFPQQDEAQFFSTWKPWAVLARAKAEQMMVKARSRMVGDHVPPGAVRHYTRMRNLTRRLAILATANVNNWIVEELTRGYQFDPVQPAKYSEYALLLKVPEIVVISATLRPKTLFMMGIGQKDFDFQEYKSDFDPKRCPFYYIPTMRVDSKHPDLSALWMRLDQVAGKRRDRNGIVHTISYTRRREVQQNSRFYSSMFVNERGEPATGLVEEFKANYPGAILVSPSVGQGFDFAMKTAEWQFICKLPFPPPSKILKARTEADPEYPYHLTMQKLEQTVGRIMRDHQDQGETFLCDDNVQWFFRRWGYLASKSIAQFYRPLSASDPLPRPPERLK